MNFRGHSTSALRRKASNSAHGTHFTTPGNTISAAPDFKAALEAGELVWAHAHRQFPRTEFGLIQSHVDNLTADSLRDPVPNPIWP